MSRSVWVGRRTSRADEQTRQDQTPPTTDQTQRQKKKNRNRGCGSSFKTYLQSHSEKPMANNNQNIMPSALIQNLLNGYARVCGLVGHASIQSTYRTLGRGAKYFLATWITPPLSKNSSTVSSRGSCGIAAIILSYFFLRSRTFAGSRGFCLFLMAKRIELRDGGC